MNATTYAFDDVAQLLPRLGLDLAFTTLVVLAVYHRVYRSREMVFTYYVFNIVTYSLCVLLRRVPMDLGFAFGLFAVFGILRYRTEPIRMRDLTYLFIVLGLGILNGVATMTIGLAELLVVNGVIVATTAALELVPSARGHGSTPVLYDKLALLAPAKQAALYADLTERIGLPVVRVQIHRVDLLRDAAEITAFYKQPRELPLQRSPTNLTALDGGERGAGPARNRPSGVYREQGRAARVDEHG